MRNRLFSQFWSVDIIFIIPVNTSFIDNLYQSGWLPSKIQYAASQSEMGAGLAPETIEKLQSSSNQVKPRGGIVSKHEEKGC